MARIRTLLLSLLLAGAFALPVPGPAAVVTGAEALSQETASAPAETRSVRVGDIDMSYRVMGKGFPLLLITGFSATMDLWDPFVLEQLSANYKVIIFDNRGTGGTTATEKPFSISLFVEDTLGLMDALHIGKAHLLGWSMGTFVASELALRHPDRVGKLVLYAAHCGGKEMVPADRAVSAALMDSSGSPQEKAKRWISILFPHQWLKDHPDFVKQLPRPKEPVSVESIVRQGKAIAGWEGVCGAVHRIVQPTLLVTGTEDVIIPPANSLLLASRIPNSWLIRMPGGHANMYQYPQAFSRYLLTFLEE